MYPLSSINPFQQKPNVSFSQASKMLPTTFVDNTQKTGSFKDLVANMVADTNKTLSMPDELMHRA